MTPDGRFTQPEPDQAGRLENLLAAWRAEKNLFVLGSGAALLEPHGLNLTQVSHVNLPPTGWQVLTNVLPLAPVLARYAVAALPASAARHPLQACYIRPSDAEMKAAA